MSGGGTRTTTSLDPNSQRAVGMMRQDANTGALAIQNAPGTLYSPETMSVEDQAMRFMNPWFSQVLDPVNASFDRARDMSRMRAGDAATGAGAFGSARHGVAEAVGMGEIERGRAQVLGNLLNTQWQNAVGQGLAYQDRQRMLERMQMMDPYLRSQMAVGLRSSGLGPTGSVTTQKQEGNTWGQIAGLGLTAAGTLMGGPAGGAATNNLFGSVLNTPSMGGSGVGFQSNPYRSYGGGVGFRANQPGVHPLLDSYR